MSREVYSNNLNWTFYRAGEENCREQVCLPHCVKLAPANSSGGRNYQGECTYEKALYIEESHAGQKVYLEFEGAMGATHLYVNGRLAKSHYCGYTPLVADVTDHVNFGAENTLRLVLDNSDNDEVPPGKPQATLDFTYEGGLYRDTRVIYTDRVHVTNAILANQVAGGGIFVYYPAVSEREADVAVQTHIINEYDSPRTVVVKQEIYDADGSLVCSDCAEPMTLPAGEDRHVTARMKIAEPKMWSMDEPNLYLLRTGVWVDGECVDCVETTTGVRTFAYTVKDGIIFNGKPMRISGANHHQTYPYIGNALPKSLLIRDVHKLKETGIDNLRSHYPFASCFMDECDKVGMSMIVSNVGWQFFREGIFCERTKQNLRDIIRWHRNHPCIILWEPMLNETAQSAEYQQCMHDIVHEEYPYAPCYTASDWGPTDVAYSEYDPEMLGKGLERFGLVEQKFTGPRPRWIREYGDYPDNFWDQNSAWRIPREWGDYAMLQTVERMIGRYDATNGEFMYVDMYNRKDICGYGVWAAVEHNRGYHINPNWCGYFDLFRIPKFAYHFMRSQLDVEKDGPVLFIANYWLEVSSGDVTIYSNADSVRLYHDDVLVGELPPDDVKVAHPPFTFKDVRRRFKRRERSVLRAEAIYKGEVVATAVVKSPGVPKRMKLEADFMDVPLVADGSDIVCVHCKLLDDEGAVVPMTADSHLLRFEIEGEGKIIGDDSIGANPIYPRGGIASILVQSTTKAGEIKIRVREVWEQYIERDVYNLGLCDAIAGDELVICSREA